MRTAVIAALATAVSLLVLSRGIGASQAGVYAARVAALMGVTVAASFLWLWYVRATPLALGMVLSWTGASVLLWGFAGRGEWALMALSVYLTGAAMHLRVIAAMLPHPGPAFAATITGAAIAALLLMPRP